MMKHPAPCEYPGHGEIPKPCICANPPKPKPERCVTCGRAYDEFLASHDENEDHALATEIERQYASGETEKTMIRKPTPEEEAAHLAAFLRSQGVTEAEYAVARRLVLDWADTLMLMGNEHVCVGHIKQLIFFVAKHARDAKVQASIDVRTCCPHDIACGIRET